MGGKESVYSLLAIASELLAIPGFNVYRFVRMLFSVPFQSLFPSSPFKTISSPYIAFECSSVFNFD